MTAESATSASVHLWGNEVGTAVWDDGLGHFTYSPAFLETGLQVAPLTMPLGDGHFSFPELNTQVFKGLPGFLADSLPDKFGSAVIGAWLVNQGRSASALNPVERLRLLGSRAMGALEYSPELLPADAGMAPLDLACLVELTNRILSENPPRLDSQELQTALETLIQIGISADGARAKVVVGYDPVRERLLPGADQVPEGFEHWLLKLDGITGNRDREANDPQGWGRIEYAYYLMARQADITMSECRLLREDTRAHFITRRFDREPDGSKVHRQSLCALGHMDFDALGAYSYEEVLALIRQLGMPQATVEEQFRRMVFNVLARNHDDHPKNIAFLMDRAGTWFLAPAYDLTFAYNPEGQWTHCHQMTLNGKRDHFTTGDLLEVASRFDIAAERADTVIEEVGEAVRQWPAFAREAGVERGTAEDIGRHLRLHLL